MSVGARYALGLQACYTLGLKIVEITFNGETGTHLRTLGGRGAALTPQLCAMALHQALDLWLQALRNTQGSLKDAGKPVAQITQGVTAGQRAQQLGLCTHKLARMCCGNGLYPHPRHRGSGDERTHGHVMGQEGFGLALS